MHSVLKNNIKKQLFHFNCSLLLNFSLFYRVWLVILSNILLLSPVSNPMRRVSKQLRSEVAMTLLVGATRGALAPCPSEPVKARGPCTTRTLHRAAWRPRAGRASPLCRSDFSACAEHRR